MDKILVCEYSKKTLCLSVVNFIMLYKEVPTFYVCEYHFFVCMVIKRKLSWQDFPCSAAWFFVSKFIKLILWVYNLQTAVKLFAQNLT